MLSCNVVRINQGPCTINSDVMNENGSSKIIFLFIAVCLIILFFFFPKLALFHFIIEYPIG